MKQLCKRRLNHLKDSPLGLNILKNNSVGKLGTKYSTSFSKSSQKVKTPLSATSEELLLVEEHIRPLIKEELRQSIQSKRIAKGLPSIENVDFDKPKIDVISPEALVKREKRRERNKLAAARCRFKKKLLSEKLQQDSDYLENANKLLRDDIYQLQDELQKLTYILELHNATCPLHQNQHHSPSGSSTSSMSSAEGCSPSTSSQHQSDTETASYYSGASPWYFAGIWTCGCRDVHNAV